MVCWPSCFEWDGLGTDSRSPREDGSEPESVFLTEEFGVGDVCFAASSLGARVCEELFPTLPRYLGGYVLPKGEYRQTCERIEEAVRRHKASEGRDRR